MHTFRARLFSKIEVISPCLNCSRAEAKATDGRGSLSAFFGTFRGRANFFLCRTFFGFGVRSPARFEPSVHRRLPSFFSPFPLLQFFLFVALSRRTFAHASPGSYRRRTVSKPPRGALAAMRPSSRRSALCAVIARDAGGCSIKQSSLNRQPRRPLLLTLSL